jgi:lambda repressor-like predicted transcriptional regulator
MHGSPSIPNSDVNLRFFWDGGLLANTPLRQTVIAHRNYWFRVRKMEDNLPSLTVAIINLHPLKQEYVPYDYDGVVDRKNDIIYHDKTEFDEHAAILISDFQKLAASLIKLSKDNGASEKSLQMILQQRIDSVSPITGKHLRCGDLLKARVDVNFVIRLQRNNDLHTISNKIFDFSDITIKHLLHDWYRETQPQVKRILRDTSLMPQDK